MALVSVVYGLSGGGKIHAQNGQPHSLKADVTFQDVTLSWKAPADEIVLQWHDDEDYNGLDGVLKDPQGAVEFYAASKFTADELAPYSGQTIDAVRYWEYREVFKASVIIFEDGKAVYEQNADLSEFEKNSWRNVKFDKPYTIPEGKEVMIAVKFSCGRNMSFVAICDRVPTIGKGNLYSYDGKTWHSDCPGDFLITALLHNEATTAPTGYNVYRDDTKVNTELLTDATSYTLTGETEGTHKYKVGAVYTSDEKMSAEVTANAMSVYSCLPSVSGISGTADHLSGTLTWATPLKRGSEMTWSNKELANGIGGTSSTNPQVWIIQQFSPTDLAAFPDHQITAINSYIKNDGTITTATAFVMKNGVIDYFEEISADAVEAITPDAWNKFTLVEPYKMELGNEYAFGLYYKHTKGGHPVGVDNGVTVEGKGNTFSTSGPSSSDFGKSDPVWKTLSSGDIAGNFMLTADVEAMSPEAAEPQTIANYDVYRDGEIIASNLTETTYKDEVPDLGTYTYAIVANGESGEKSEPASFNMTYTLPSEYTAPVIVDYEQTGKDISMSWSSNAYEMKKYSTASYIAGFAEEIAMMYGARFTAEELADYAGYKLYSMTFGIGEELDAFSLKVITEDGEVLYEEPFVKGDIEPGYIYTLTFEADKAIKIPEGKDIYLAYDATLPAGVSAILLDGGPEVNGGAVVNLTGGTGPWLNLGTIASDFAGTNIVISALAVADNANQSMTKAQAVRLNGTKLDGQRIEKLAAAKILSVNLDDATFGVEPLMKQAKTPAKSAEKPVAKSYRIYSNGEIVTETEATKYTTTLTDYGVFDYYITTVYENGWESPASDVMRFTNTIAQRTEAPYDLKGTPDGKNLNLTWKPVSSAPVLTYDTGEGTYMALGMTGGSTLEGYTVVKFPAEEMTDKVNQEVSHISFRLNSTELLSAAAVVMYGENIVYMQDIDLSTLAVGANTVRLDKPVPVVAGQDLSVGYFLSYRSGVKPLVGIDGSEVIPYYSDLISSSGTPGYWKSLAKDFGFAWNWAISATLKTADQQLEPLKAKAAGDEGITYTVYRDGTPVQTGITATEFVVENAAEGVYTITATVDGDESAESNSVNYSTPTGIDDVTTADVDSLKRGPVYTVDGRMVNSDGDLKNLPKGIYIMDGKKFIVK